MKATPAIALAVLLALPGTMSCTAGVIINEIFYNAPDDLDDLQWVELHNTGTEAVPLGGWQISKGIEYRFGADDRIPAGGYLVICKDKALFSEIYPVKPHGQFKKTIGRGGDTLELVDGSGKVVDKVTFDDKAPWPIAADGASSSLERISPAGPGDSPDNWDASPLPTGAPEPAGTPGAANASFSANLPPVISSLALDPAAPLPGQPIRVSVRATDPDGIESVEALYQVAQPGTISAEKSVRLNPSGDGAFTGEIPAQEDGRLLRVRVRAVDKARAQRLHPSPNSLVPAVSAYVQAKPAAATMPLALVIHPDERAMMRLEGVRRRSMRAGPFGLDRESYMLYPPLEGGVDLSQTWTDISLDQDWDDEAFGGLRGVFAKRADERLTLMEQVMSAEDPQAELRALPRANPRVPGTDGEGARRLAPR